MTIESKEEAMDLFERTRAEWLAAARAQAALICGRNGSVTADDIHDVCPIPRGVDGRVMGAVFRDFTPDGFVISRRPACHKRPIRRFVQAGGRL